MTGPVKTKGSEDMFESETLTLSAPGLCILPSGAVVDLGRLVWMHGPDQTDQGEEWTAIMSTDGGDPVRMGLLAPDAEALRAAVWTAADALGRTLPPALDAEAVEVLRRDAARLDEYAEHYVNANNRKYFRAVAGRLRALADRGRS